IKNDLTLEEAILFAGGLDAEAYNIGYLKRKNPNNSERMEWRRFNVKEALRNPSSEENFALMPLDTIEILANPTFTDQYEVRVAGAVRMPSDIQYDETLTLRDALTLSGGLKLEAASNQIEIFRLVIRENQPTQTIVATVEVDEDLNVPIGGDFPLAPFDLIVVRSVPDFELFQTVAVGGEVQYPGPYALLDKNERLLNVIERAGGLTEEAFPSGATLYRVLDSIGFVVMELEDVLKDKDSRYNFILKEGDEIFIPKQEDLVALKGEIRARELYPDKYLANGRINTAYHSGKRANFYINEYGAGVGENGKRGLVTVEHPNGRIAKTVDLLVAKIYPKVEKGSIITVGKKQDKDFEREQRELEREPVDWGRVLADSIGQAGSIISLILLIQRL
ncbi:MAG: SLBB domain-containing protein, partial [Bacteroidota bacterium]